MPGPLNELRSKFPDPDVRFRTDGSILGTDGREYPPYSWRSGLERRLARATEDPGSSRKVVDAFESMVAADLETPAARAIIEDWLAERAVLLRSAGAALIDESFPAGAASENLEQRLAAFLAAIAPPSRPAASPERPRRIVILSSEHGGGISSAAAALHEHLRADSGYLPLLFDIAAALDEADSLVKVLGISERDVWNRLFAELGDADAVSRYQALKERLHDHLPSDAIARIKAGVTALQADLIIAPITGYVKLIQLVETGAPLVFVHTDFCLNPKLAGTNPFRAFASGLPEGPSVLRGADARRVRIWLASDDPDVQLVRLCEELGPRGTRLFQILGYPVRLAFRRPQDPAAPARARARLGLDPAEHVVLLGMGRDGSGDETRRWLARLLEAPPPVDGQIRAVVICGQAEATRREIERWAASLVGKGDQDVRVTIEGSTTAERLADWMTAMVAIAGNPPGVMVTKPGGATTAECAAMGISMISFPHWRWEVPNHDYAVRHGFAEAGDLHRLPEQVGRALRRPIGAPSFTPIDWSKRLIGLVEDAIGAVAGGSTPSHGARQP